MAEPNSKPKKIQVKDNIRGQARGLGDRKGEQKYTVFLAQLPNLLGAEGVCFDYLASLDAQYKVDVVQRLLGKIERLVFYPPEEEGLPLVKSKGKSER